MYLNIGQGNSLGLGNVGSFANFGYWSSTEFDLSNAWFHIFNDGYQYFYYKGLTSDGNFFRAVRDF
jgi:hypothetical protein